MVNVNYMNNKQWSDLIEAIKNGGGGGGGGVDWQLVDTLTLDKTTVSLAEFIENAKELMIVSKITYSNSLRTFSCVFPANIISSDTNLRVLNVGSYFYSGSDHGFIALNNTNNNLSVRYCIFSGSPASNYQIEIYYR